MKSVARIIIITPLLFSFVFLPFTVSAGGNQEGKQGEKHQTVKLDNPLGETKDIPTLIKTILEIVLKVGVPIIALAIIWTGYLFISAKGKPEALAKAKESFVWTVVGSLIMLGAYVIAQSIVDTINAIRS